MCFKYVDAWFTILEVLSFLFTIQVGIFYTVLSLPRYSSVNLLHFYIMWVMLRGRSWSWQWVSMWVLLWGRYWGWHWVSFVKIMSLTLSMWVLSCRDRTGEVCMSPSSVAMSSSPWGDRISCCMMLRACCRQSGCWTIAWTQRAPPHSRNTSVKHQS